jgi:8-oxo-dGTP diphosphatase
VIDWAAPDGERPNPIVHFVFDGGTLSDPAGIVLQQEELDDYSSPTRLWLPTTCRPS